MPVRQLEGRVGICRQLEHSSQATDWTVAVLRHMTVDGRRSDAAVPGVPDLQTASSVASAAASHSRQRLSQSGLRFPVLICKLSLSAVSSDQCRSRKGVLRQKTYLN